jgi:hypothetical protein
MPEIQMLHMMCSATHMNIAQLMHMCSKMHISMAQLMHMCSKMHLNIKDMDRTQIMQLMHHFH